MSIEFINGCVIEALEKGEIDILLHCVNCQGVMGSGIAKTIKDKYPNVFEHYISKFEKSSMNRSLLLGQLQFVPIINKEPFVVKYIANVFAQLDFGSNKRHLNYAALAQSFSGFNEELFLSRTTKTVIGFPYKFASDRAGGDWEIVLEMIEFYFKDHIVKIYKLKN